MSSFFKSSKKAKQKEEMEALIREKETLLEEKNTLRESDEEKAKKIDELEERTRKMQTSIDKLTVENNAIKEKMNTEEPYDKIYNERQDLLVEDNVKSNRISELESERTQQNETIESLKSQINNISEEKEQIATNMQNESSKYEELSGEKEELLTKLEELSKEKGELEDAVIKEREKFHTFKAETEEETPKLIEEEKKKAETQSRAYIEDLRKEITDFRNKVENLQLESEALKSENEALFRANESKKKDIVEFQVDLRAIKNDYEREKLRFQQFKTEMEEEKKKTEFVMVSKSAKRRQRHALGHTPITEENDSEEEHLVSVVEAARAESETLREKERELRRRVNQLQIDKEELFRSGTNMFAENKTVKQHRDDLVNERETLIKSEATLMRRLREKDDEIRDLKKTVDDLYYQNMAIKSNEENEKRNPYVVLMGNETVKQLEKEKEALQRRVKFLERENHEIDGRVVELEKQSNDLIQYSKKYDKHSSFPPLMAHEENQRDHSRSRGYNSESDRESGRGNERSHRGHPPERAPVSRNGYSEASQRPVQYHEYREETRPPRSRPRSPDYYKPNAPPFAELQSRQSSVAQFSQRSGQSHNSRVSLPHIGSQYSSPTRPRTNSSRADTSRKINPLTRR